MRLRHRAGRGVFVASSWPLIALVVAAIFLVKLLYLVGRGPPHPKHQPDPVSLWPSSLCLCVAVFTMFIVVLFPQVLSTIALALFILLAKPFWSAKSWESVKAQELLRCACFHVPYIPPKVQVLPTRRDDERSCQ